MTKEQMIWDEALRRNEQKGWSRTKKILLITPALSVLLGYLIFKTQVFQNLWEKGINVLPSHSSGSPENPSQPMLIMSSDPLGFWARTLGVVETDATTFLDRAGLWNFDFP